MATFRTDGYYVQRDAERLIEEAKRPLEIAVALIRGDLLDAVAAELLPPEARDDPVPLLPNLLASLLRTANKNVREAREGATTPIEISLSENELGLLIATKHLAPEARYRSAAVRKALHAFLASQMPRRAPGEAAPISTQGTIVHEPGYGGQSVHYSDTGRSSR